MNTWREKIDSGEKIGYDLNFEIANGIGIRDKQCRWSCFLALLQLYGLIISFTSVIGGALVK